MCVDSLHHRRPVVFQYIIFGSCRRLSFGKISCSFHHGADKPVFIIYLSNIAFCSRRYICFSWLLEGDRHPGINADSLQHHDCPDQGGMDCHGSIQRDFNSPVFCFSEGDEISRTGQDFTGKNYCLFLPGDFPDSSFFPVELLTG